MKRVRLCLLILSLLAAASQPVLAGNRIGAAELQAVFPARSCASLAEVSLVPIGGPGSKVTKAVEAEENGLDTCSVEGLLAPAVKFKLVLPTRTWTQRYLQVGCGGLCGNISLQVGAAEGCISLHAGEFAIAATDMGHEGNGAEFGRDAQLRADFAYRAQHITALAAKQLIHEFYGQPPAYSYFNGCSDGGAGRADRSAALS